MKSQIDEPHSPTTRDNNGKARLSGSDRTKKLSCLLLILPLIDGKRLLTVILKFKSIKIYERSLKDIATKALAEKSFN